ncbi:MAG: GIY-YIG nuclease family protein [Patescibacteria group bacterium]
MYYVYIIKLKNGKFYTGSSSNLQNRIKEHDAGRVMATKAYRPVRLVYYSAFKSKSKAVKFELYLKTGSGIGFRNKRFI